MSWRSRAEGSRAVVGGALAGGGGVGANRDAELEGPWNRLRFAVQAPYADLLPRGGGGEGGGGAPAGGGGVEAGGAVGADGEDELLRRVPRDAEHKVAVVADVRGDLRRRAASAPAGCPAFAALPRSLSRTVPVYLSLVQRRANGNARSLRLYPLCLPFPIPLPLLLPLPLPLPLSPSPSFTPSLPLGLSLSVMYIPTSLPEVSCLVALRSTVVSTALRFLDLVLGENVEDRRGVINRCRR